MPLKVPDSCRHCFSSELVHDDSSGQLACRDCGNLLGGFRQDFSVTGEARVFEEDRSAGVVERVSAPADPLLEGLDGPDFDGKDKLKYERSEGFRMIEKACGNLGLSGVCIELAKTYYKNVGGGVSLPALSFCDTLIIYTFPKLYARR
jgi:hypothetical protein